MKKSFCKLVGLLLLLPLFTGCNDTDDVAAIFTGKTWKLNYITEDGKHDMFDFWESEAARKKSIDELDNYTGTYNIYFEGAAEGEIINGSLRGTLVRACSLEGTWGANGKNNDFQANVTAGNYGTDALAKNFLEGLNTATSYEGDTNGNLFILYKSGQRTFRMVFRVINSN
ncbi:DUF4847 family protein [uncultured Bacteroides sp.]|uniref:DUF4847 family protein n=1 Tax=uncultured Bacteroides sp. TaxID=162156 RepID=UPI0025ECE295|nr:DUF4847 family protein [uncultured Bacteroides sp.]